MTRLYQTSTRVGIQVLVLKAILLAGLSNAYAADVTGTDQADTLTGTRKDDVINGLDGNDFLNGLAGNDQLLGGPGNDTLIGSINNDLLDGGPGVDLVFGSFGNDKIIATNIDNGDHFDGGPSSRDGDVLDLSRFTQTGATGLVIDLRLRTIQYTSATAEVIKATLRSIEVVQGSNLAQTINGDSSDNDLFGGSLADVISGAEGSDLINGAAGVDTITTGTGRDELLFDATALGQSPDQVTDFDLTRDRFNLEATAFQVNESLTFVNSTIEALPPAGFNVIVLQTADDDSNAATAFNARSAARLIGTATTESRPGFFVYFNSGLQVNRLVFTPDLSNGESPLTVLCALNNLTGTAAIEALPLFSLRNFFFQQPTF